MGGLLEAGLSWQHWYVGVKVRLLVPGWHSEVYLLVGDPPGLAG